MTLLHVLAQKPEMMNGTRVIVEMLEKEANLDVRSSFGSTPLIRACYSKHIGAMEVLLEARADLTPCDDEGATALRFALRSFRPDRSADARTLEAVQLLVMFPVPLDEQGPYPPIVEAIHRKLYAEMSAMIKAGAKPLGLAEAVSSAPLHVVKELVDAEADPEEEDEEGYSCLMLARDRQEDSEEVIGMLNDLIDLFTRRREEEEARRLAEEADALGDLQKALGSRVSRMSASCTGTASRATTSSSWMRPLAFGRITSLLGKSGSMF